MIAKLGSFFRFLCFYFFSINFIVFSTPLFAEVNYKNNQFQAYKNDRDAETTNSQSPSKKIESWKKLIKKSSYISNLEDLKKIRNSLKYEFSKSNKLN